jgi:hypothetical protein
MEVDDWWMGQKDSFLLDSSISESNDCIVAGLMIAPDLARRTPTQSIYPHDKNNIPVQQNQAVESEP